MTLARGFKSYCEDAVTAVRGELRLRDDDPIDMNHLADHLCIPVHSLGRLVGHSRQSRSDPHVDEIYKRVSAFTFFDGPSRAIVFNEEHADPRQRSDMAHELAHALLQHPPRGAGLSEQEEEVHEDEAAWMGGVLMLTARQARRIVASRMSRLDATLKYRVSPEMLRFRLNVTGAARLAAR